jgi:hypothetical protein
VPFGHRFAGYYLPFPDTKHAGLVSTISDDPPVMNWIYVDRTTYEVKFGNRAWAEGNYTGHFDCTRQDKRLTLHGWEGFYAVKEGSFWALYFDIENNGLEGKVAADTPAIELSLLRTEILVKPPKKTEETQDPAKAAASAAQEHDAKQNTGAEAAVEDDGRTVRQDDDSEGDSEGDDSEVTRDPDASVPGVEDVLVHGLENLEVD